MLHERDRENVDDWKLRRATERERLLRQMMMEEEDGKDDSTSAKKEASPKPDNRPTRPFPPSFPSTAEYNALQTPFEKLEHAEKLILSGVSSQLK